ncbi:WD repeat-containing protein 61 [Chelonia mydas]|uniref:Superkiller complex protein 8 n=1 Tax=Chelonia mydas TaxID=8469 RepID=M7ASU9_CHEMY|nr:WD repeat-containing protein 61 [Chelonia mydas]
MALGSVESHSGRTGPVRCSSERRETRRRGASGGGAVGSPQGTWRAAQEAFSATRRQHDAPAASSSMITAGRQAPKSDAPAFLSLYSILFKQEQAHDDAIWSVAWGKNKRDGSETVISGSLDDLVKVWKWTDEKLDLQWTLEGHQLGVVSVDISHTGTIAASSSLDAHIRLWDLETGKQIKSIDAGPGPRYIRSPDGKYLASGAIDGIINIFDIATGKLLHTLEGHAMPIRSLTFSPDSQLLVTASDDGYIKIYDVSSDKSVKVWDAGTRTCVHTFFDHQDQVWGVKYNGNGSKIVSVGDDQEIHIYDCPI